MALDYHLSVLAKCKCLYQYQYINVKLKEAKQYLQIHKLEHSIVFSTKAEARYITT